MSQHFRECADARIEAEGNPWTDGDGGGRANERLIACKISEYEEVYGANHNGLPASVLRFLEVRPGPSDDAERLCSKSTHCLSFSASPQALVAREVQNTSSSAKDALRQTRLDASLVERRAKEETRKVDDEAPGEGLAEREA